MAFALAGMGAGATGRWRLIATLAVREPRYAATGALSGDMIPSYGSSPVWGPLSGQFLARRGLVFRKVKLACWTEATGKAVHGPLLSWWWWLWTRGPGIMAPGDVGFFRGAQAKVRPPSQMGWAGNERGVVLEVQGLVKRFGGVSWRPTMFRSDPACRRDPRADRAKRGAAQDDA